MDLEASVRELAPRMLRYTRMLTGDWSLAEEVSQDVLAILVRRWRQSGPPDSVEAFVFAIARRRAIRSAWKRRLLAPLEAARALPTTAASPYERCAAKQSLDHALAALDTLSRKEAQALALVALGELSVRQAAEVLGIGVSAVKMRVLRARNKLQQAREVADGRTSHGSEAESRLSDPAGIG